MNIKEFYKENYKKLLILPFVLLILAFIQIGVQYSITGNFVNKGITLKGGSTITVNKVVDSLALEQQLRQQFPNLDISIRIIAEAGRPSATSIEVDEQKDLRPITSFIESYFSVAKQDYTVEVVGSSLGNSFFKQTIIALLIAFVFMGIVVAIYFRNFVPSVAVILAAFSDIVITFAIFNLTGVKLSSAGIAAFLMLIGYSVDTDILLTTRVMKRHQGTVFERVLGAMRTGMTMTATTLIAITVSFFFSESLVIKQIMMILFIGLLVDLINTWIQNVGILRWYMERKRGL